MTYRVREYTRDVKPMPGSGNNGFKNYYVYCSGEFTDYREAIIEAIKIEKETKIKNWVDCMDTYDYFDNEVITNDGIFNLYIQLPRYYPNIDENRSY
jgi:hypothetical protein